MRFAAGSLVGLAFAATFDSDWCEDDTRDSLGDCHVSALPIVRSPAEAQAAWEAAERAVDDYLAAKGWRETTAVLRLMREVEVEAPRSRTTTLDMPFLQQTGASLVIRDAWHKRMGG